MYGQYFEWKINIKRLTRFLAYILMVIAKLLFIMLLSGLFIDLLLAGNC